MEIISRQFTNSGGVMEKRHHSRCAPTMLCILFREIETASHLFASCPKTRVIQGAYL